MLHKEEYIKKDLLNSIFWLKMYILKFSCTFRLDKRAPDKVNHFLIYLWKS